MIDNQLIHRRNLLLFYLMCAFYFLQVTINISVEGLASVFPPAFLYIVLGLILLLLIRIRVNSKVTMYIMVGCMYLYFYVLLTDSPFLVNYLFMWLGLPLSAIYQKHRVVLLAGVASIILTFYSFFYLHEEIFPNVVKGDFVYLVLFGVFTTAFLLTFIRMTLRLWEEVRETNDKLQELAYHDPLTGAANRLLLKEKFDRLKARNVQSIGLLYMDMNGFKSINDTYGHDVGDQLLAGVVSRVNGVLWESDLLCRIGGDEFVILLSSVDELLLEKLCGRIKQALEKPFDIHHHTIKVSASIGWSITTEVSHTDLEKLLREADVAMYIEKGRDTWELAVSSQT